MTLTEELEGRSGVVTGAGSGIGRQVSLTAAAQGGVVVGLDVDADGLAETGRMITEAGVGRFIGQTTDVTDEDSVRGAVERAGVSPLSFLVNAAGIEGPMATLVDTAVDDWDRVMRINVRGGFVTTKVLLPAMIAAEYGAIANIASVSAFGGAGELSAYTAAKHGVAGLTRATVAEVARSGVRANAIGPGPTKTPLLARAEANNPDPENMRRRQLQSIPQGRYGEPQEIADLVLFLISDRSSYINGAVIPIDGGMTAVLN